MMKPTWIVTAFLAGCIASASRAAAGQAVGGGQVEVLTSDSYLRGYLVFRTPVVITPDGQVKVALEPVAKEPKPLPEFQSPPPPAAWLRPDFDDSTWERCRAPVEVDPGGATGRSHAARHTATVNTMICLRAKFIVEDPAKVDGLKLSLDYVGGAAVYVNGRELARAQLPAGPLGPDSLAAKYPDNLYCEPNDLFLQDIKKNPAGFERRYRKLAELPIPANLLRKGTNVLALEIHRAPINEAAIAAKRVPVGGMYVVPGIWAYAALRGLSLRARAGSALVGNTARPKGVQVWNCTPYETVECFDYGDAGEPLRPIAISALRNGVFSGRLVVSADQALRGLNVTLTDLVEARSGARIPAAGVGIRCAAPAVAGKSWAPPHRFDGLMNAIPAEVAVVKAPLPRETYLRQPVQRKSLAAGAVAPLWITVRVPADAPAGRYEGTVHVAAEGLAPTAVPLRLTVHDWTLPDPRDLRVRNLGFLSPESLARHYEVPFWSDRHFELMGRSLALMAEINSRQVLMNLAIDFYGMGSNQESMVRWVRNGDGSFRHDFTLFEKYLDLVQRTIGKPLPLRLNCWGEIRNGKYVSVKTVSLLGPAAGKLEPLEQPVPGTEESLHFWKPVLDEARKRIEKRGWYDVTCIGHNTYCWPPLPEIVSMYRRIWPDGVWGATAHNGNVGVYRAAEKGVTMPVLYGECVWTEGRLAHRGYRALRKDRPGIWCTVARNRHRDYSPLTVLRDLPEEMIMRGHDGVGQLGADVFPIRRGDGRYSRLFTGRGGLGPECSTLAILAPGPDGPIATERFEMFREGLQLCQAILFLEQAAGDNKLPADLAQKVDRYLDHRSEAFLKHWSAGRLERDELLLALCAEAAKVLEAK
jgi:hypothetical protein